MTERRTLLDESTLPFPFCPGCGHPTILEALDRALAGLGAEPRRTVIVTDIGCSGLSDRFFATNAFHGLHGRSVTYASGIKLANPELTVLVLMGDGGCGIGGHHLLNAARRNVGVTVIVFNNLNYGMTGGEHSVTTPPGGLTATTPYGQLERPLDICRTVAVNGATFVARTTTFDRALPGLLEEAIAHDGFALVDVWELCTAYYAPRNRLNRRALEETMAALGFPTGVLHREERPEFSRAYREAHAPLRGEEAMPPRPLEPRHRSALASRLHLVFAGAAGRRIGTAAATLSRGAVLSGLWATQRDDYPVTVRTGYSVSEVIVSPEEILFPGVRAPDAVVALFPEGVEKVRGRIRELSPRATVFTNPELPPLETRARVVTIPFAEAGAWARKKAYWSLMALPAVVRELGLYPLGALREAAAAGGEELREAVEAGEGLRIREPSSAT